MIASNVKRMTIFAAASAMALAFAAPSFAAGSDSGNSPGNSSNSGDNGGKSVDKTMAKCKHGMVYSNNKKKCVKANQSGMNDTQLFETARAMAYAGQYEDALVVLRAAKNQNDPRILNYMGYANRKAGRVDLAMTYYQKALAIDGNYLLARSYMGQGLIVQGKIEEARAQLIEIRDRGGKDTYAYHALYDALKRNTTY
jgi:tetratricopeptide (TPR) repeat protein